jgi:fido (protein-threonine AMPylation protein)
VQANASAKIADAADCCAWHLTMFRQHVPLDYYAGNFRQVDTTRPCLGIDVWVAGVDGEHFARVPQEVATLFERLRKELNSLEYSWPELTPGQRVIRLSIVLGRVVGRFIQIHPFVNGNGRTSRLLWAWGLLRFGVPPQIRVRQHPEQPNYNSIMADAMRGDFNHLSLFILEHLMGKPPSLPISSRS